MQETRQVTQPLHIENTVLLMGRQDLSITNAFNTYREMKLGGVISGSVSFIKAVLSKGVLVTIEKLLELSEMKELAHNEV